MNDAPRTPRAFGFKDLLIAVLAILAAAQGYLLLSRPAPVGPPPAPAAGAAKVLGVAIEPGERRTLVVAFDQPVAEAGAIPEQLPATISPQVEGQWAWVSPSVLQFTAQGRFERGRTYAVTLEPPNIRPGFAIASPATYRLPVEAFVLRGAELRAEPEPREPAKVRIVGRLTFNDQVKPGTLLEHLRLTDPARKAPLKLRIADTWASNSLEFVSEPVAKAREARTLTLTVDKGLTPERAPAPLGKDATRSLNLVLDPVLKLVNVAAESRVDAAAGGQPGGSITLAFSTPVAAEALRARLAVSQQGPTAGTPADGPPLRFAVAVRGQEAVLSGPFAPGKAYVVNLPAGLAAADGAALPKAETRRVQVPDLEPRAWFRDRGLFLSAKGQRKLAVRAVNADSVQLSVDRVYPNNIFALFAFQGHDVFQDEYWGDGLAQALGDRVAERTLELAARPNETREMDLPLDELVRGKGPGLYRLGLTQAGGGPAVQRWALVTDLGLVAKRGDRDLAVWALSLADAAPRHGADITVLSAQNQVLARGKTDEKGFFRATLPKGPEGAAQEPFLILAGQGGELGFLLPREFRTDTTGLDVDGAELSAQGYQAFLWGERDLYRPGDTVRGAFLVRDQAIAPAAGLPLTLRLKDPQGRNLPAKTLKTDAQGLGEFSFELPDIALTGMYTAELTAADEPIGQYRFLAEEFVPDRVAVDIRPQPTQAKDGAPYAPAAFSVAGNYLFGPPAAGQAVEVRVRLAAAPFAPPGLGDYVFGDPTAPFEELDIFKDEGMLGPDGQKTYSVPLPTGLAPPAALEAVVTARVRESGGRGVTARRAIPAHVHAVYPGLKKLERQGFAPGEAVTFAYVAVSPDGKPAQAGRIAALRAELYEDRWQTVLRRGGDGGYRYESTRDPVLLESRELPPSAQGTFEFIAPGQGGYHVLLRHGDAGAVARLEFFSGGAGYAPWAVDNPARLTVALDKAEYAAGETAVAQVRAPFPGRLLLTVENDQVRQVQTLAMTGNTAEMRIPVDAALAPNAYVTAMVVRGARDLLPGTPARAFGAAPLFVDRAKGRMALSVQAPAEMRPGNRLEVAVAAEPGARVTVAAVDEGILRLIAQKTPDPLGLFYAQRRLGVETFDAFALLYPEARKLPAGGDGFLAALRQMARSEPMRRDKPVAFWSGVLTADKDGTVRTGFDIPQFQGAVRVMAVSALGRRFASAERTVVCKSPLVLLPTAPRFLAAGDAAVVSAALRNDTGRAGEFRVSLAAQGPAALGSPADVTLALEPGQEKPATFRLNAAQAAGGVSLSFAAQGNGENTQATVRLPARWALPSRGEATAGVAQGDGARVEFPGAGQLLPQTARVDLRVGGQPLFLFAGNLKGVLGYPYGCLEQTVSRALPLIHLGDLAMAMAAEAMGGQTAEALVQRAIVRVRSMQAVDGGFAMWPGGGAEAHPWASVYAAHFLMEAARAGHFVDDALRQHALGYARERAAQAALDDRQDRTLAAYALYALALGGQPEAGLMDNLKARKDLTADQAGLLAACYALRGDRPAMADLLGRAHAPQPSFADTRQTDGILDSPIRGRALLLAALADAAPDDPRTAEAAAALERLLAGTPRATTQENGFSLLAMGKLARSLKADGPFSGKVLAGDKTLGVFASGTPLSISDAPAGDPLRIVLDQGRAFYSATLRGVPTGEAFAPAAAGLSVKRELLTRDGQPLAGPARQGELVVARITVASTMGAVGNVAVSHLLPAGLEVENPRLTGSELLPWMEESGKPTYLDLRDDRILAFLDLSAGRPAVFHALLRAVTPGDFALPPVQAEAMYDPAILAVGPAETLSVTPADAGR